MRYRRCVALSCLILTLAVATSSFPAVLTSNENSSWAVRQDTVSQTKESRPEPSPSNKQSKKQQAKDEPKSALVSNDRTALSSAKKQQAMVLIDEVLSGTSKIQPAEYGVLAQTEAATLLWQIDRERAHSILKDSVEALDAMIEAENTDKGKPKRLSEKQQSLRFKVFLKIARLNPALVKQLAQKKSGDDKSEEAISDGWTAEARALMLVAEENIDKNPELAEQLAEQSLPLGIVSWNGFLHRLNNRDSVRAEHLATKVMIRLRDSSAAPSNLFNLNSYALHKGRSSELRNTFFLSMAARLRRDIRANATTGEITSSLNRTRMLQRIAVGSPRWAAEFGDIESAFENMFNVRSLPIPGAPRIFGIDSSMLNESMSVSAMETEEQAQQVVKFRDPQERDRAYGRLAIDAAMKADCRLAEDLLSKIKDEDLHHRTSLRVYTPLVRKALSESNWIGAQEYASKITDSLGRTLVLDSIGKAIPQTRANRQFRKEFYRDAVEQLKDEEPAENVAKSYLILAKSLFDKDPDASLEAIDSAIYVINKLSRNDVTLGESEVYNEAFTWISWRSNMTAEEILDLTDMVGTLFKEIARRDANNAYTLSYSIAHRGMHSFAQLGIASALLERTAKSKAAAHRQPPVKKASH